MKKAGKVILIVFICILVLLLAYLIYVKAASKRLEDQTALTVDDRTQVQLRSEDGFSILSYNIGMGIYSKDFGFFMDGGKSGKAASKEEVLQNTRGAINTIQTLNPDFIFVEETGKDCSCNYHVDQLSMLREAFEEYDSAYAQNWNSPYFIYPFFDHFGKAVAGLTTFSRYSVSDSIRYSLPLEDSFTNFVDLDRCYMKSTVPMENGKNLILYCLHASAYTGDAETANRQIGMLMEDMSREYESGNYIIAGGDWNRNLEGNPQALYGVSVEGFSWLTQMNLSLISENFTLVSCLDADVPIPSVRNADGPYDPATQAQGNIDGFIVSDNIAVKDARVIDTGFEYSDHNPVFMQFEFVSENR